MTHTNEAHLHVSTDGDAGPYIMVPVTRLEAVRNLLDANRIRHWDDEEAISIDGRPEIAVINLDDESSVDAVQVLLDTIS